MVKSGKQVKDALGRGAVFVNGESMTLEDNGETRRTFAADKARYGRFFLVKVGKKNYHLFERA